MVGLNLSNQPLIPNTLYFSVVLVSNVRKILSESIAPRVVFPLLKQPSRYGLGALSCSFLRVMRGNAALELVNHSRLVFSEGITRKSKAGRKLFLLIKLPNALSSLFGDVSFRVGLDDFLQGCLSSINAAAGGL